MSRYIDADKLKNELDKMCREYTQEKSTFHPHIDFVLEVIDQQPTADVVEVVRCKDCIEFKRQDDECGLCEHFSKIVHERFYCMRGNGGEA